MLGGAKLDGGMQESESLAAELRQQGMRAACYHADMDAGVREAVHSQWSAGACSFL